MLTPLDEESVRTAVGEARRQGGAEAIEVCFIHSYGNREYEWRATDIVREEWAKSR